MIFLCLTVFDFSCTSYKVNGGPAGRQNRNCGVHPFKAMTKNELIDECQARGIETSNLNKPKLQDELISHLNGVHRVPFLMMNNHNKSLSEFNLQDYEVVSLEPLYDIKEHSHNILTELPNHLNESELKIFNTVTEYVQGSKERLRGCDYRLWSSCWH